jgi:predicted aspartyl protease
MNEFRLIIQPDEADEEAATVFDEGMIGSHRYQFVLDTGASRSCVTLDEHTAGYAAVGSHMSGGVFARSTEDLITVPTIELGPISKKHFTLARVPKHLATKSLIGMDILRDYSYQKRVRGWYHDGLSPSAR